MEMSLVMKLGSLVVHAQEESAGPGTDFDRAAIESLANDPEVVEWLGTIDPALLPVKR